MSNVLEKYIEDAKKQTDPQRAEALKVTEENAQAKIKETTDAYNSSINDVKTAYESEYQKNAVQKLINERTIAEKNANLGLSDSGLNRTQLTANQLSYANQKGNIDLVKQTAIDTLQTNLASAIATIKLENENSKLSINQSYDQYNDQLASEMYSADLAEKQAALQNTQAVENVETIIYAGVNSENQKRQYYTESGKMLEFDEGINPYTGTVNSDTEHGTFSNGYQPNNIDGNELVVSTDEYGNKRLFSINGREGIVWKVKDDTLGKEWVWDDVNNRYVDITNE